MYAKFLSLEDEKRQKIINAAIREFESKGYDLASTNEIVKNAGISKGLLFHYFKNKKQLLFYLFDYGIEVMTKELFEKLDFEERDFFKKIILVHKAKLDILKKHPGLFTFMQAVYMDQSSEIKDEMNKKGLQLLHVNLTKIFENTDTSRFKEGLSLNEALNIITWSLEGLSKEAFARAHLMNRPADYDAIFAEAEMYYAVFKRLFYQDES